MKAPHVVAADPDAPIHGRLASITEAMAIHEDESRDEEERGLALIVIVRDADLLTVADYTKTPVWACRELRMHQFEDDHPPMTCVCKAVYIHERGFIWHIGKCDKAQEEAAVEERVMQTNAYPLNPSNRSMIRKLEAWGFKRGKRKGDFIDMEHEDGTRFNICGPNVRRRNDNGTMHKVYTHFGGAEVFWQGPVTAPMPKVSVPALKTVAEPELHDKPRAYGNTVKIVSALQQANRMMSTAELATATGLTREQVVSSAYTLKNNGVVESPSKGLYRLKDAAPADHRVDIDIDVTRHDEMRSQIIAAADRAAEPPYPAVEAATGPSSDQSGASGGPHTRLEAPAIDIPSVPPLSRFEPHKPKPEPEDDWEDTIATLVDVLFPSGMKITGHNLRALDRWRAATVALLNEVEQ